MNEWFHACASWRKLLASTRGYRVQLAAAAIALWASSGCATSASLTPSAPVVTRPVQQIPVDLDVVVRIDLASMRRSLGPAFQSAIETYATTAQGKAHRILALATAQASKIWVGFRPDLKPSRWDNVIVMEGDFSSISTQTLSDVFRPPRDLGAGFLVYDVWVQESRVRPARLYTYLDERWIFASPAEVDALSRVVERHRLERDDEPLERGLLSVSASLARVSENLVLSSPKAAEILSDARSIQAWLDLSTEGLELEGRISFETAEEAALAARAVLLLGEAGDWPHLRGRIEAEQNEVVWHWTVLLPVVDEWLAGVLPAP